MAVDLDRVSARRDALRQGPKRGVVLQQVREGLGVADVVDGDELHVRVELEGRPEDVPADAPETVDANLDRHTRDPLLLRKIDDPHPLSVKEQG